MQPQPHSSVPVATEPHLPQAPVVPTPPRGPNLPSAFESYGHRHLMAETGSFLTRAREAEWIGGEAPYAYAQGNPLKYIDPSGLAPCIEKDECENYPHEPGWYDGHPVLKKAIDAAAKECPAYSPAVLKALLFCMVARETRGAKDPWNKGTGPAGPCQIWPDKYKDITCTGLNYRTDLEDHIKCCARLLCQCLKAKGGDIVKGCGTTGSGKNRKGQWQVINESGEGLEPHFKCCLKRQGWSNPTPIVPKPGHSRRGTL